jgi:nucleoid DNA-binding protein
MEKRKLKSAISRRPKDRIGIDTIVKEVSRETGFTQQDIKEVYKVICKVIKKRLWNGQSVIIPFLGTIMPFIKPRCTRHALYGGRKEAELIEVPPKWTVKFVPIRNLKEEFANKTVTKEQEDSIYKD